MSYGVKILADPVNPVGIRLVTWELTYPRFVHSELMTHRMFSRSSASSRAIPIDKMLKRIEEDPVLPVFWGENQAGMQAATELSNERCEGEMNGPNTSPASTASASHTRRLRRSPSLGPESKK